MLVFCGLNNFKFSNFGNLIIAIGSDVKIFLLVVEQATINTNGNDPIIVTIIPILLLNQKVSWSNQRDSQASGQKYII